jgi:hypothetical protein
LRPSGLRLQLRPNWVAREMHSHTRAWVQSKFSPTTAPRAQNCCPTGLTDLTPDESFDGVEGGDRRGRHGRKEVGRHCLLAQHSPVQANRAQIFQIARPPRCPFCSLLHYPELASYHHDSQFDLDSPSILDTQTRRLRPSPTPPWHPTTMRTTLLSQPANENNPTLFQTSLSTVLSSTFIL